MQSSHDEFLELMSQMCAYYSRRPDNKLMDIYWQDLKNIPIDLLQKAFQELRGEIERKHYMPTVAELRGKIPKNAGGVSSSETCWIDNCELTSSLKMVGEKPDGLPLWLCHDHSEEMYRAEQIAKFRDAEWAKRAKFQAAGRAKKWIEYWERYYKK